MSRAYHASIGIFCQQFYTFNFGANFHIALADVASLDIQKVSQELAAKSNTLTVGPITFNLGTCSTTFKGCRLDPTSWVASEYADTLIIADLPATGEEIAYLVKSLIHLLTST